MRSLTAAVRQTSEIWIDCEISGEPGDFERYLEVDLLGAEKAALTSAAALGRHRGGVVFLFCDSLSSRGAASLEFLSRRLKRCSGWPNVQIRVSKSKEKKCL